jgi:signal transduction histidine kinase
MLNIFKGGISPKTQMKLFFLALATIIVGFVMVYTNFLVSDLIEREKINIRLYTQLYNYLDPVGKTEDLTFIVEKVSPIITFPLIRTDENNEPFYPYIQNTSNIAIDTSKSIEEQREYLKNYIKKMDATYQPLIVTIRDESGEFITKFHYANSALVDQLQLFPLIEIAVVGLFIFLGYLSFSSIKRSEESKVWVGMAKEAAHQLGTPLSSLLAWIEIIKYGKDDPAIIDDTVNEMQKDVDRLSMIATRFSKIGSLPELKETNISTEINSICDYFDKRLPVLGKKIDIIRSVNDDVYGKINIELFAWVIENLLKNAAEAIEEKNGAIFVTMNTSEKHKIQILITDTGKGMTKKQKRQVFMPGYTTKKRGWGLGLSLSKRIVEEYHDGKICVKDTSIGKGATFLIELPYNLK